VNLNSTDERNQSKPVQVRPVIVQQWFVVRNSALRSAPQRYCCPPLPQVFPAAALLCALSDRLGSLVASWFYQMVHASNASGS
jgi:hypothetical protein